MPKYLTHITLWKYILTLTSDFQAIQHWARTSYRNNTISTKHTQTQTFNGPLSGTTQVGWYQKKQSPTPIHPDHQTSFINFLHLLRSIASSLFSLRAWQSFSATFVHVLVWSPLLHTLCFLHPVIIIICTVTACFALIPLLCHVFLSSLTTPYIG